MVKEVAVVVLVVLVRREKVQPAATLNVLQPEELVDADRSLILRVLRLQLEQVLLRLERACMIAACNLSPVT